MLGSQFGHLGAPARQDDDQVAAFKNQQGLAHRAATDIQRLGDLDFLNPFALLELPANDALGQVLGNLFGEAVRGLERHVFP